MKRNYEIQKEWESIGANFSADIRLPLFSIPEQYFENLPNRIIEGIKAISVPDTPIQKIDVPYTVPKAYFEELEFKIIENIKQAQQIIEQTSINGLSKANIYAIPNGYFDQFAQSVLAQINQDESIEEELIESPLLQSLKGVNPFEKPATIEVSIPLEKVSTEAVKEDKKIDIPMGVRKRLRWTNIAAAAAVALFFVSGASWLHFEHKNESKTIQSSVSHSTDKLSVQELANKKLAAVSDEDIKNYIDMNVEEFNEFMLEANITATGNNQVLFENALENISDEDLETYLNNGVY